MHSVWSVFFVTIAVVRGLRVDDDEDLRRSLRQGSGEGPGEATIASDQAPTEAPTEMPTDAPTEALTEASPQEVEEECKDDDKVADMCATWAAGDGCSSNMAYMHVQCKKTCDMCEGDATKNKVEEHKVAKLEKDFVSASYIREKEFAVAQNARKDAAAIVERQTEAVANTKTAEQKYFEACASRKAALAAVPVAQKAEADATIFAKEARHEATQKHMEATLAKSDVKGAEDFAAMTDGNVKEMKTGYAAAQEAVSADSARFDEKAKVVQEWQVKFDDEDALRKKAEEHWAGKAEVEEGLWQEAEAARFEAKNANADAVLKAKVEEAANNEREEREGDISDEEKLNSIRGAATAAALDEGNQFPVGVTKYHPAATA